jgi:hypothetical protein
MARLPIPGGDNNTWGTILNDYLSVSHNSDGTLKVEVTDASKLQGTEVSSTAPTDNQVLTYNNSTGQWEAQTPAGGVGLSSSPPTTSAVGDTAATGSGSTAARSDHTHGRESFGTPGSSAFGDTASAGSATSVARSDHRHSREAGIVVAKAGTDTGTRPKVNFIEGSNVTITTADNAGSNRVDVTLDAATGASLSANNTWTGTNTYNQDVYFKSGRPWVDVRAYGAQGNGTDATAAIQAAIDTIPGVIGDGSGYIVYIPDGIYLISAPLLLKPGVTLRGVGQRPTILRMANGANCTMITNADINNATYVAIENLRLDGNKANNSAGNGISMASMFMTSRIQNVMIENCPYYGLAIGGCDELEICNLVVGHNGLGGLSADGCNRMSIQNVEAGSHEVGPGILIKNSYGVVVGLNMNVEQSGTATGLTGVHLDSVYDSTFAGIAFSTGAVSHAIGVQISNTSTPGQTRGLTLLGVHNGSPGYSTLIDDQVNSIQKTGTNVAFYTTDPETLQLRNHRFIRRTSGGWVCNSAGITNLDTWLENRTVSGQAAAPGGAQRSRVRLWVCGCGRLAGVRRRGARVGVGG